MLTIKAEREQALIEEVWVAVLFVLSKGELASKAVYMMQIEQRLQKDTVANEDPSQSLESVLLKSQENSRMVPKALARANKTREKCDLLLRTLQTRLELPCDDSLEPSSYPRPPQGSRREVRVVCHVQRI